MPDEMLAVAERDRQRMDRIAAGDSAGFWELVRENRDDLKWCGSSPFYTFLKVRPGRTRHGASLRAMEYRCAKRGQFRGDVVSLTQRARVAKMALL